MFKSTAVDSINYSRMHLKAHKLYFQPDKLFIRLITFGKEEAEICINVNKIHIYHAWAEAHLFQLYSVVEQNTYV